MSDFITKKLAIFKTPGEFGGEYAYGDWAETLGNYARMSEYIEVQFPALKLEDVVAHQLDSLSAMEIELRTKFQSELDKIMTERGKLLALTHVEG